MSSEIQYWDRKSQSYQIEKVYGDGAIKFAYENPFGRFLTAHLFSKHWISKLYGNTQSTKSAAKKIPQFIKKFEINMSEYEEKSYDSFNDFFIRKFRPGLRPFPKNPQELGAFSEARYLAYKSINDSRSLYIKGSETNLTELLGSESLAREFEGGALWIARLCPVDYHRFHYPALTRVVSTQRLPGLLHSVNPIAMKSVPNLIQKNERHLTILETPKGSKLAYLEVGALMVGKIIQSNCIPGQAYGAGREKGYFLFGASTVVLLAQKGTFRPSPDLIDQTQKGFETRVLLGENIGTNVTTA
ncbi:MAG: phosphatidylserine decarboxylase [Xanthomonadaceae bacterium]|nr:phosphatidylserine decarboxylase [Xanthomonadaceae bacterium]